MVLFLEEDHYVAEDFLHVLRLMERTCKHSCERCNVLSLGTYLKTYNYYADFSRKVPNEFHTTRWNRFPTKSWAVVRALFAPSFCLPSFIRSWSKKIRAFFPHSVWFKRMLNIEQKKNLLMNTSAATLRPWNNVILVAVEKVCRYRWRNMHRWIINECVR